MKKVTFAVIGMGNRGSVYAGMQHRFPEDMQVVAIADNRPVRIEAALKKLPDAKVYSSAEELLAQPKLADVCVIATQDRQHLAHAVAAMEKGYDLLLEKPVSVSEEECIKIAETANRLGRKVVVCHVLRYTPFYRTVKKLLDEGHIGRIENVIMEEQVGYYHYAHSYVRGNWHRQEDSSAMILAKCCHDMDLILWLTGKDALSVSSIGSLDYFKAENCPEGATERCTDGCKLDCPFNAPKFYLSRIPGWPSNVLHPEPTEENIMEVLRTTDYGKCVYKMDNDVVDHQVLNVQLTGGVTAMFSMSGFTCKQTRLIRIQGTEGEIWGDFREAVVHWQRYGKEENVIDLNKTTVISSGHGGGDAGLVKDVISYIRGDDFDSSSVTSIDRSIASHLLCFAAEKSRVLGGEKIDLK